MDRASRHRPAGNQMCRSRSRRDVRQNARSASRRAPQRLDLPQPAVQLFQLAKMRLTSFFLPSFQSLASDGSPDRTLESNRHEHRSHYPLTTPGIGYSGGMGPSVSIDIDKHTAEVLQVRAAELGVTVPQLIAELAALDSTPRDADADEIAELDRRAAAATSGPRVPHERVVQWLGTWGTPGFRQWPDQ
jgi:hypothetical protein